MEIPDKTEEIFNNETDRGVEVIYTKLNVNAKEEAHRKFPALSNLKNFEAKINLFKEAHDKDVKEEVLEDGEILVIGELAQNKKGECKPKYRPTKYILR